MELKEPLTDSRHIELKDPEGADPNSPMEKQPQTRDCPRVADLVAPVIERSRVHPGRIVEVGLLQNYVAREFSMHSEGFPIWLLALERSFCSKLTVLGFDSAAAFALHFKQAGIPATLIHRAIGHLGLGRVVYQPSLEPPPDSILLASGPLSFLTSLVTASTGHPTLMLSLDHWRGRRALPGPAKWIRLQHQHFGGSTHFVAMFGSMGLPCFPLGTELRRNVAHIFDYGLRPDPLMDPPPLNSMSIEGVLHPADLERPIIHPTTYYKTGWGVRCLNADELGLAFGFPVWLRTGGLALTDFPCVPVQIMDGCLRAILGTKTFTSPMVEQVLDDVADHCHDQTFLSSIGRYLPHSWISESLITAKAVKHDDAKVEHAMWDQRILLIFPWALSILAFLRMRLMALLRLRLGRELRAHLRLEYGTGWVARLALARKPSCGGRNRPNGGGLKGSEKEEWNLKRDAAVGIDVLHKFASADWWNWTAGSTLIFWRWPAGFQRECARDGMPPWVLGSLPRYKRKAPIPKPEAAVLLAPKFLKIIKRGYVTIPEFQGAIKSLVDYFYVPKDQDIRPVYNGASCGINLELWAPNFWLPTPKSALRVLDFAYHSVDIDLGEFFLNFPFPEVLRAYSGIDLTPFYELLKDLDVTLNRDKDGLYKVRWERCWMGCKPSPFFAVRFYYWADEFARGNPKDPKNHMRWDVIKLNLPGDMHFDPSKPRVMKWDSILDRIAGDLQGFVDDLRASGFSAEEAWQVARQFAASFQYLGIQVNGVHLLRHRARGQALCSPLTRQK
jgi:hypothetical protein